MGARFLSILLLPHFGTQSSHLCASLAGCWNPLVLDLFEPWSGSALFVDGARYFPISLGDYSYFSLDSHDASREKHLPTTFEQIPNFVAAPDLSDEKPPLEQKMAAEHEIH